MESHRFDAVTRALGDPRSRRNALAIVGGLLGLPNIGAKPIQAKKKKKKKATLCLDGQTIQASKKKKKKLLKSGATLGACSSPPPPPPPGCTPACAGKPCGVDDGCGSLCGCAAGSLCHNGACQTCTVTCDGNGPVCGAALQAALDGGGTVYACPGRYVGVFALNAAVTLIGAGEGEVPASNTVLDANGSGRTVFLGVGIAATLEQLHVTGGKGDDDFDGGGILNLGLLTMTACTISKNSTTGSGGGIYHAGSGPLTLNACTISGNTADTDNSGLHSGGGISQSNLDHPVILNTCTVSGNTSKSDGGGIRVVGGTVTITGSIISGNHAEDRGGGIYNIDDGIVTLDLASRVTGNSCPDPDCGGGIINAGTITLNGAIVSDNDPDNCAGNPVAECIN